MLTMTCTQKEMKQYTAVLAGVTMTKLSVFCVIKHQNVGCQKTHTTVMVTTRISNEWIDKLKTKSNEHILIIFSNYSACS